MSNMDFECLKDKTHKFSLAKPAEIEGNWDWKGKVHCPYCGTEEIQIDARMFAHISMPKTDLSKVRRENREQTIMAQRLAGEAQAKDRRENPEVTLAPIQGSGKFGGDSIKVKKGLFEKIRQATPDSAKIAGGGEITPQ